MLFSLTTRVITVVALLLPALIAFSKSEPLPMLIDSLKSTQVHFSGEDKMKNIGFGGEPVIGSTSFDFRRNSPVSNGPTDPPNGIPLCPKIDSAYASVSLEGLVVIQWSADVDSLLVGTRLAYFSEEEKLISTDTVWGELSHVTQFSTEEQFRVEISILCSFKGEIYEGDFYEYFYQAAFARPSNICYNNGDCAAPQGNPYTPLTKPANYRYRAGDIISYATLPLRIAEITRVDSVLISTAEGSYNYIGYWGIGEVALPFDERVIEVEFDSIGFYNPEYGYANFGNVNPIYSAGGAFELPTDTIGETAFCIPEPIVDTTIIGYWNSDGFWMPDSTRFDNYGFNIDGTFIHPPCDTSTTLCSSEYDPQGFGPDGVHANGTPYNYYGCSRDSLDENGNPCNTFGTGYSFLDPANENYVDVSGGTGNGATPLGTSEFIEDNELTILQCILDAAIAYKAELAQQVADQQESCDIARADLQQNIDGASVAGELVKGPGDEFFSEGMHKNFDSPIDSGLVERLGVNREAKIVETEYSHTRLYQCDEALFDFMELEELGQSLLEVGDVADGAAPGTGNTSFDTDYENAIKSIISGLLPHEINDQMQLTDSLVLCDSILSWTKTYLFDKYEDEVTTMLSPLNKSNPRLAQVRSSEPMWTTAVASSGLSLEEMGASLKEELSYGYQQGWASVAGYRREELMLAIVKAKSLMASSNTCETEQLPVSITHGIASFGFEMVIDSVRFDAANSAYSRADVYYIFEATQAVPPLYFRAKNVEFNHLGFKNGEITLELLIDLNRDLSVENVARLELTSASVTMQCLNVVGVEIEGELEFCRSVAIPLDAEGKPTTGNETLTGTVTGAFDSWDDFTAYAEIDGPFAIAARPDVHVDMGVMLLDRSSISTPSVVSFPTGYQNPVVQAQGVNAWRGFYAERFSISIPASYTENEERISFNATNLFIDKTGLSVVASITAGAGVDNSLISLSDGSLGGWSASVDSVGVEILHNRFRRIGLEGLIHVPIGRATPDNVGKAPVPEDCISYGAEMSSNGIFHAYAEVNNNLKSDLLGGTLVINRGSSIELVIGKSSKDNGVSAKLSGSLTADGGGDSERLSLGSVSFQNFHIQTPTGGRKVVPSIGTWGFDVEPISANFGVFEVTLGNPGIYSDTSNSEIVGLSFVGGVTVTDDFAAAGSFVLKGILESGGKFTDLKYHSFGANGLALKADMWGTAVDLQLAWSAEEVPTWGRAFYGRGTAVFKEKITLAAAAQFGRVGEGPDEKKYFFVDVMASGFKAQLFPGFNITGAGGGLRRGVKNENLGTTDPFAPAPNLNGLPLAGPSLYGHGLAGAFYTPDPTAGLGLNLIVVGEAEKEGIANAYAKLGMEFDAHNSLTEIYLDGYMKMMTDAFKVSIPLDVTELGLPPVFENAVPPAVNLGGDATLTAKFNANLSLVGRTTFNATLDAFLVGPNVRGAGPDNSLVRGQAYFGPGKWYIKMGGSKVGERAGLLMEAPPIATLTAEAYFQAGNGVDPIPPLPPRIKSFFGTSDLVQVPNRGSGTGVAFGAHASLDAYIPAGIFWASISLAAGVDVNLQKYVGVSCANTNSDIGINGFYAQGQLYAYAAGEAGLKIGNKKVSVLNVEAGILFQASLPNPFYAKGVFKGRIKVGPYGGNASFNLELGEQCDLIIDQGAQASSAADPSFDYILMPALPSGSQLDLETTLGYELRFEDQQTLEYSVTQGAQQVEHSYTIRVDDMSAFQMDNGVRQSVHFGLTKPLLIGSRQIQVDPSSWWPGSDTVYVELKFSTIKDGDTSNVVHDSTYLFTYPTNDFPKVIARKNILYSYPMQSQREFLPEMHPSHYIGLDNSQAYLFTGGRVFGVYTDENDNILHTTANVDYDATTNEINSTPRGNFLSDTTWYHFYLVKYKAPRSEFESLLSVENFGQVGFNGVSSSTNEQFGVNSSPHLPRGLQTGRPLVLDDEEYSSIYSVGFRTSLYNTLEEKVTALSLSGKAVIHSEVDGFRIETQAVEFDKFESALDGYFVNPNALVHMRLDVDNGDTYIGDSSTPGDFWKSNIETIQGYYRAKSDVMICEDSLETELQYNLAIAGTPFGPDSVTISNAIQLELTNQLPSALSLVQDLRNEANGGYGSPMAANNVLEGGGAGGERAGVGTPPAPDESALSESNFLVYTFPAVVEYAVDNWFDFINEVEDQALTEMMEIGCFSDPNETEEENYFYNRQMFRESLGVLNLYWNSLGNRGGVQASRAPLPGAKKFREIYSPVYISSAPPEMDVTFQYKLPGPVRSSPVSQGVISKKFTIEIQ
ncbi:MAG: hypothetical protein AB8F78_09495 [Saprospiraceae bacterium]